MDIWIIGSDIYIDIIDDIGSEIVGGNYYSYFMIIKVIMIIMIYD
jgi:hypothetical protein